MRKLVLFFVGLLILGVMSATLLVAGVIYDSGNKTAVEVYFFQTDDNYARRPGDIKTAEEFGVEDMRVQFISKYLTEYFFVSPDIAQLEARSTNRSTLRLMSLISVYNKWIETVLPELRELAAARALRIVKVTDAKFISKTKYGEYWQVSYDLTTWDAPNNFSVVPRVESATLFMDISYEPGMRETVLGRSLSQYMESGGDPAVAFKFGVRDIVIQE